MKFLKTTNTLSRVLRSLGSTTALRLLLAVSVLFFAASQVCLLPAETDEEPDPAEQLVHIPDPALRSALEEALGKTAGEDITQAEMATLTRFAVSHEGVRDLTGLEYATNLRNLQMPGNAIADLSPLRTLTQLSSLNLRYNWIADVSPLRGLTRLGRLNLENNHVVNVSPLMQLPVLHSLNLDGNQVADLSPFEEATAPFLGTLS